MFEESASDWSSDVCSSDLLAWAREGFVLPSNGELRALAHRGAPTVRAVPLTDERGQALLVAA
jgi:hypothetical protein